MTPKKPGKEGGFGTLSEKLKAAGLINVPKEEKPEEKPVREPAKLSAMEKLEHERDKLMIASKEVIVRLLQHQGFGNDLEKTADSIRKKQQKDPDYNAKWFRSLVLNIANFCNTEGLSAPIPPGIRSQLIKESDNTSHVPAYKVQATAEAHILGDERRAVSSSEVANAAHKALKESFDQRTGVFEFFEVYANAKVSDSNFNYPDYSKYRARKLEQTAQAVNEPMLVYMAPSLDNATALKKLKKLGFFNPEKIEPAMWSLIRNVYNVDQGASLKLTPDVYSKLMASNNEHLEIGTHGFAGEGLSLEAMAQFGQYLIDYKNGLASRVLTTE